MLPPPDCCRSSHTLSTAALHRGRFVLMADDLTGAADTAVALAGRCQDADILLEPHMPSEARGPVVAIDLDTRRMPEVEAVHTVRRFADSLPASGIQLFKKIDSTLRGHVGAELAAIYQSLALRAQGKHRTPVLVLVAPAHPRLGRLLKNGCLVMENGFPNGQMEPFSKPAPDRQPIAADLARHGFTCVSLPIPLIRARDRSAMIRHMEEAASRPMPAMVCDTETMDDLQRIVDAALSASIACIWVGSGGLAYALDDTLPSRHQDASHQPFPFACAGNGSRLFLVGSYSSVARQQMHALLETNQVQQLAVSPRALAGGQDRDVQLKIDSILAKRQDLILCIASEGEFRPEDSLELACRMATLVAPRLPRLGALVCCGGDTSRALFQKLGIQRLRGRQSRITGATRVHADTYPDLPIIIKAGAFGDARSLVDIRDHLAT